MPPTVSRVRYFSTFRIGNASHSSHVTVTLGRAMGILIMCGGGGLPLGPIPVNWAQASKFTGRRFGPSQPCATPPAAWPIKLNNRATSVVEVVRLAQH
jgi:hypothetical protein